jgi:fatty acid amide hydrolase 2
LGDNGVLLFPNHPNDAPFHYASFFRPYNFAYWAIFNVLKFPVTQVPMGLSKKGLPLGIQVYFNIL